MSADDVDDLDDYYFSSSPPRKANSGPRSNLSPTRNLILANGGIPGFPRPPGGQRHAGTGPVPFNGRPPIARGRGNATANGHGFSHVPFPAPGQRPRRTTNPLETGSGFNERPLRRFDGPPPRTPEDQIGQHRRGQLPPRRVCVQCRQSRSMCDGRSPPCSPCLERNLPCKFESSNPASDRRQASPPLAIPRHDDISSRILTVASERRSVTASDSPTLGTLQSSQPRSTDQSLPPQENPLPDHQGVPHVRQPSSPIAKATITSTSTSDDKELPPLPVDRSSLVEQRPSRPDATQNASLPGIGKISLDLGPALDLTTRNKDPNIASPVKPDSRGIESVAGDKVGDQNAQSAFRISIDIGGRKPRAPTANAAQRTTTVSSASMKELLSTILAASMQFGDETKPVVVPSRTLQSNQKEETTDKNRQQQHLASAPQVAMATKTSINPTVVENPQRTPTEHVQPSVIENRTTSPSKDVLIKESSVTSPSESTILLEDGVSPPPKSTLSKEDGVASISPSPSLRRNSVTSPSKSTLTKEHNALSPSRGTLLKEKPLPAMPVDHELDSIVATSPSKGRPGLQGQTLGKVETTSSPSTAQTEISHRTMQNQLRNETTGEHLNHDSLAPRSPPSQSSVKTAPDSHPIDRVDSPISLPPAPRSTPTPYPKLNTDAALPQLPRAPDRRSQWSPISIETDLSSLESPIIETSKTTLLGMKIGSTPSNAAFFSPASTSATSTPTRASDFLKPSTPMTASVTAVGKNNGLRTKLIAIQPSAARSNGFVARAVGSGSSSIMKFKRARDRVSNARSRSSGTVRTMSTVSRKSNRSTATTLSRSRSRARVEASRAAKLQEHLSGQKRRTGETTSTNSFDSSVAPVNDLPPLPSSDLIAKQKADFESRSNPLPLYDRPKTPIPAAASSGEDSKAERQALSPEISSANKASASNVMSSPMTSVRSKATTIESFKETRSSSTTSGSSASSRSAATGRKTGLSIFPQTGKENSATRNNIPASLLPGPKKASTTIVQSRTTVAGAEPHERDSPKKVVALGSGPSSQATSAPTKGIPYTLATSPQSRPGQDMPASSHLDAITPDGSDIPSPATALLIVSGGERAVSEVNSVQKLSNLAVSTATNEQIAASTNITAKPTNPPPAPSPSSASFTSSRSRAESTSNSSHSATSNVPKRKPVPLLPASVTPSTSNSKLEAGFPASPTHLIHSAVSSPPSQKPDFTLADMALMHYYYTETAATLGAIQNETYLKIWQDQVPRLAQSHSFLMHAILAVAASHQERTAEKKAAAEAPRRLAIEHFIRALTTFQSAASTVGPESAGAVFSFCTLVSFLSFSVELDAGSPAVPVDSFAGNISILQQVTGLLEHQLRESIARSPVGGLLDYDASRVTPKASASIADAPAAASVDRLETLIARIPPTESADYSAYLDAIVKLRHLLAQVSPHPASWARLVQWPLRLTPAFLALLSRRRPPALAILAHWLVPLYHAPQRWFVGSWPRRMMRTIARNVPDPDWAQALEWPLKELELAG